MAFNQQETSPVFIHGIKTVGITPEAVSTDGRKLYKGIVLKAATSNTGSIHVGFTAAAADTVAAFPLYAGDSLTLAINAVDKVYVVASNDTQSVYFIGS